MLARSLEIAPAQRVAMGIAALASIACIPWIGWYFVIPLTITLVGRGVVKLPSVQMRYGLVAVWGAWALGLVGMSAAVALMAGPYEYAACLIAIPTLVACSVFPTRTIPLVSVATGCMILLSGVLADLDRFLADPAPTAVTAALLTVVLAMSAGARTSESDSYESSQRDALTGAFNRFALSEHLTALRRDGAPTTWSLIIADIDHFKSLNDRFGHGHGDRILVSVSAILQHNLPKGARLYRLGGEEFLIVTVDEPGMDATTIAERLRREVQLSDPDALVTMSFGVATSRTATAADFDRMFAFADNALYEAKNSGRNAVSVAAPDVWEAPEPELETVSPTAERRAAGRIAFPRMVQSQERLAERDQLIDMMDRHFKRDRYLDLLIIGTLVAFIPALGLMPAVLGAVVVAGLRLCRWWAGRLERPERVVIPIWAAAQLLIGGIEAFAGDEPWGLWALAILIIAFGTGFPWRHTRWATAYSAALMVGAALIQKPDVFTSEPQAVAMSMSFLVAAALLARDLGRRTLGTRRAMFTDALTGLANRTAFDRLAGDAVARGARELTPVAVVMADIDLFKTINDRYGHPRGDQVLISLASRLQGALRSDGTVFRLGGEEFCILLQGPGALNGAQIADRLRLLIAREAVGGVDLTMSFGVCVARVPRDLGRMLACADDALYRAKSDGRNRVAIGRVDADGPDRGSGSGRHPFQVPVLAVDGTADLATAPNASR